MRIEELDYSGEFLPRVEDDVKTLFFMFNLMKLQKKGTINEIRYIIDNSREADHSRAGRRYDERA
jgi:hypothetical protein